MHELSLAQSLMRVVAESAGKEGIRRVSRVTVVIGEWSAVSPDALEGSFSLLAETGEPLFQGASLVIVPKEATGRCEGCGHQFSAEKEGLTCPHCGRAAQLASGSELYVDSYEGES